jgi:hypothetical protein
METLPGIAHVLRSPVADAIVHLSRAGARLEEFRIADSEELLRYAVRRSLLNHDEAERVIAEIHAAQQKRIDRAADRAAADRAKARAKPKAKAAPKPKKPKAVVRKAKPARMSKAPRKAAKGRR